MFALLLLLPLVSGADYAVVLEEKSAVNQSLYQFARPFELLNNFQSSFHLAGNHRELMLSKVIDRDAWCAQNICSCEHCSFTLELFSKEDKSAPATFATINVTITDRNDHACQFLDVQSNISLSESIQIGHRFPIARAIDVDSGVNGQLAFKLLENDEHFELNIINLSVNEYAIYGVIKHALDREVKERYELIIEAHDHAVQHVQRNRTSVTLWVLDENDNAPKFNQTEYSIQSLPEDTPVGTELLTISATDADKDLNSRLHYSIIHPPGFPSFPFVINATSGVVALHSALDYETVRSYRFLIRVSDSGLPQSLYTDTWLSISIADVNDCPVEISLVPNRRFQYENQTLFVYENTEIQNLTLGYIRLFDQDSLPTKLSVTLMMVDPAPRQDYELVPSSQINSYMLIAKQGLFDRELEREINLRLIATDGLLTSMHDLKIRLLDLNDNPGEFPSNPMKFSVEELADYRMVDTPVENTQLIVGYLNATDRDEGENAMIRYELEGNALVRVDSQTGRLVLLQPLDREQIPRIELKAKAINIAEPKWETEVQIEIEVLDVNDHIPQCSTPMHRLAIPENFPIDHSIIQINASDADQGVNGTVHYSLRTNASWPFEINGKTGEVYSRQPFDYESDSRAYFVIIDLEDEGFPGKNHHRNACQVEIRIEDVNDNAPHLIDEQQTHLFLDLQSPFAEEIILFNATDLDAGENGKVRYSLQTNADDPLFVLYNNGSLRVTRPIKQISLFKLKMLLEDAGTPPQQTLINLTIAVGDSTVPAYSTFDKVLVKYAEPKSIGLILGLVVLTITVLLFLCMAVTCLLLQRHRRRHQAAIIARNKLLCSSSQQLTSSGSTNTTSSLSMENQPMANIVQIKPIYYNRRASDCYTMNTSSPESQTYKILHIPHDNEYYVNYYRREKVDNQSSDHGYHGSYETGSSSSPSSQTSTRQSYMVNQLPDFVRRCKSVNGGFLVEMNVDGSDEDRR